MGSSGGLAERRQRGLPISCVLESRGDGLSRPPSSSQAAAAIPDRGVMPCLGGEGGDVIEMRVPLRTCDECGLVGLARHGRASSAAGGRGSVVDVGRGRLQRGIGGGGGRGGGAGAGGGRQRLWGRIWKHARRFFWGSKARKPRCVPVVLFVAPTAESPPVPGRLAHDAHLAASSAPIQTAFPAGCSVPKVLAAPGRQSGPACASPGAGDPGPGSGLAGPLSAPRRRHVHARHVVSPKSSPGKHEDLSIA